MVHVFNFYSVDSSCIYGPLGPLGITGIATIIDRKFSDFSFQTHIGWRKFIIGAREPTNAHWRSLWDLWYVKLCFTMIIKWFKDVWGYISLFLRKLLCPKWTSRTLRKSPYCELVQIAPIFVSYSRISLRGVNLMPLRPIEKFSDPPKAFIKTVIWDDFFQAVFCRFSGNFWD